MSEFKEKVEQFKNAIIEEAGNEFNISIDGENMRSGEEPNVEEALEEAPQEESPKKGNSKRVRNQHERLKNRFQTIANERNILDAQNRELMARLQEKERLLEERQYQLEQQENYKDSYYENNLGIRKEAVINELKKAKEEGDYDTEVALTDALAQINADKSNYELYKSQIKPAQRRNDYDNLYNNQNDYSYQQPYQTYTAEPENEVLMDWYADNSWADPQSNNYSPRLRREADEIAEELNERLRYKGMADLIGTPEWLDAIGSAMDERYGLREDRRSNVEEEEYESYTPSASVSPVAPVSRSGSSMADRYMNTNQNRTRGAVSLTEEERRSAEHMAGLLKISPQEAYKRYAEEKKRGVTLSSPTRTKVTIDW